MHFKIHEIKFHVTFSAILCNLFYINKIIAGTLLIPDKLKLTQYVKLCLREVILICNNSTSPCIYQQFPPHLEGHAVIICYSRA